MRELEEVKQTTVQTTTVRTSLTQRFKSAFLDAQNDPEFADFIQAQVERSAQE